VYHFPGRDGVELAWREMGAGRPLVLLHGLLGSGAQLAGSGPARALAAQGYRVILPDLRGHGDSARPHDPACYPPDVLADDGLALIGHLGLDDYDLGGYSLGGRLALRLLVRGARPGRAVVGGQGLDALDQESGRTDGHRRVLTALAREGRAGTRRPLHRPRRTGVHPRGADFSRRQLTRRAAGTAPGRRAAG
jgi:pimeloyl-ACP methyl ester carboxylesterase